MLLRLTDSSPPLSPPFSFSFSPAIVESSVVKLSRQVGDLEDELEMQRLELNARTTELEGTRVELEINIAPAEQEKKLIANKLERGNEELERVTSELQSTTEELSRTKVAPSSAPRPTPRWAGPTSSVAPLRSPLSFCFPSGNHRLLA